MSDASRNLQDAGRQFADTMAGMARSAAEAQKTMMGEMSRLFGDLRLPTLDAQSLIAAHRRNMETIAAANRVALEGAQAVARRHMEIVQSGMAELATQVRELSAVEAPQGRAGRQAELLKRSYEEAVANLRELTELVQRSNAEAVDLLNRRFAEAMDELRGVIEREAPTGAPHPPGG